MRHATLATALLASLHVSAEAFHFTVVPGNERTVRRRPTAALAGLTPPRGTTATALTMTYPNRVEFERAVECGTTYGLCREDELNELADVLETYDGCLVEEDCEQERVDRQDLANILRAIAALQLRQVYLENVNLFKERVEELAEDREGGGGLGPVMETMVRAVECASQPGLCKDYELDRLADELEAYKGCLLGDDCEQEMVDRQDVVDILRMQSALQLRQVYLENVNLFKERVDEAREPPTEPEM